MKIFDHRRFKIALTFASLIIILLYLLSLDTITLSRYQSSISSASGLSTAFYLVNDEYQRAEVKLPDVIPSNNQYAYTFSVSNYDDERHSDTNLKYKVHIRTTTNMHIEFDLFKTLEIADAESCIVSDDFIKDADGTYFRHILTDESEFFYNEDNIDYYTILFTFPSEYNDYEYNNNIDYIEINIESHQVLSSDV